MMPDKKDLSMCHVRMDALTPRVSPPIHTIGSLYMSE